MKLGIKNGGQDISIPVYWKAWERRVRFVVVGLGGTGGYLFYYLARLIAAQGQKNSYQLVLADGDIVEEKNLVRQNFVEEDVGEKKVRVLSRRYGEVYGMTIPFYPEYVKDKTVLESLLADDMADFSPTVSVLVGCVDNNRTRQLFHEVFYDYKRKLIYVDSGNDEWSGQIILGARNEKQIILPPVGYYYPDILEDEDSIFPDEESCQQRVLSSPQNIATNIMAGTLLFGLLNQLLVNGTETYGVTFNARTGQTRALYLDGNEYFSQIDKSSVAMFPFEIL